MVPDEELLATVQHRHEMKEELEADAKALEYLKNSPYEDKLADAGLSLKRSPRNSRKLKSLIQPHVAAHIGDAAHMSRMNELIAQAPRWRPRT